MEEKENKLDFETIKLLYEENSKVAYVFWEWRHKLMIRFFLTTASIFILSGWLIINNKFLNFLFVPFLMGALYTILTLKMDNVNTWILKECYNNGELLEKLQLNKESIYSLINTNYYKKGSYANILSTLYYLSIVIYFLISIWTFIRFTI
jgi:hypothetical protein